MWLNEIFKVKYPVIQGGMAHVATAEFAAAVSEAGAIGLIGSGSMKAEDLRAAIARTRALTDKPFGVNLMMLNPDLERIAALLCEEKVALITTGAGNPGRFIPAWHEAGIRVIPVVPNLGLAERMQDAGADAVIAEGQEAGGHIGEMGSIVLWPLLAQNLKIPVLAAGGIASPEQLVAAEIMGVGGFQMGTPFLATRECPIHEEYKNLVLKAKDKQVTVIGRSIGLPCRLYRNPMTHRYKELESHGAEREELEHLMLGALARAVHQGDTDNGAFMMGQCAAQIQELKTVSELLEELFEGRKRVLCAAKVGLDE